MSVMHPWLLHACLLTQDGSYWRTVTTRQGVQLIAVLIQWPMGLLDVDLLMKVATHDQVKLAVVLLVPKLMHAPPFPYRFCVAMEIMIAVHCRIYQLTIFLQPCHVSDLLELPERLVISRRSSSSIVHATIAFFGLGLCSCSTLESAALQSSTARQFALLWALYFPSPFFQRPELFS